MQQEQGSWEPALGAGIVVATFLSIALIAGGGWHWFASIVAAAASKPTDVLQAFGSLCAVVVALVIANRQQRVQLSRDAEALRLTKVQRVMAIGALMPPVKASLNYCMKLVNENKAAAWLLARRSATDTHRLLTAVPVTEIPDMVLTSCIARLQARLARFAEVADNAGEEPVNSVVLKEIFDFLKESDSIQEEARLRCFELMDDLGTPAEQSQYQAAFDRIERIKKPTL